MSRGASVRRRDFDCVRLADFETGLARKSSGSRGHETSTPVGYLVWPRNRDSQVGCSLSGDTKQSVHLVPWLAEMVAQSVHI